MKKIIGIVLILFSFALKAQNTQSQIDSIMTLYPNCTDYPPEVLILLDSLLVVQENEQNGQEQVLTQGVDSLFLNYLLDNYPNLVINGSVDISEADLITDLNLDGLGLYSINGIEYFSNLESLSCVNNNLTEVPDLPSRLEILNLRSNNITTLNPLPETLLDLDLRNNSLSTVPEFPNHIETLRLCFNDFSSIPNLPDSLRILYFAYNNLQGLPNLPSKTLQVLCYSNQIEHIDFLPESIQVFRAQNNNMSILPDLPNGIQTLDVSNNPITCVNSYPSHLEDQLINFPVCVEGCKDSTALNFDIDAHIAGNSCEYPNAIVWPSSPVQINTGTNATYLLENVLFDSDTVSSGLTLGAFYVNDFGGLSCGGITFWNGGPSSISVYSDDTTTDLKDGFNLDDDIIWLAYDSLEDENYLASVNYISGSDFYLSNSINLISEFIIFNQPTSLYGCTDQHASNYDAFALLNDSSCIFPTYAQLTDSIIYLLSVIDSLNSDTIALHSDQIISSLETSLASWNLSIDLLQGWNMFGYGCPQARELTEALIDYVDFIVILKDSNGMAFLPEWNFNGIGDLSPGYGYQIKVSEAVQNFSLCTWYINEVQGH